MSSNLLIRLLMCGESGVGKTALVLRFDTNEFTHNYTSTIGVDYRSTLVNLEGKAVNVQIWDTAGQERFASLTSQFFNKADGVVLCFDCSSRPSFERVQRWFEDLKTKKNIGVEVNVILCCAKCDLGEERVISEEEGSALSSSWGIPYMETSAKTGYGVKEMFLSLARQASARKYKNGAVQAPGRDEISILRPPPAESEPDGCC
jgi:small GTP-binding protein